MPMIWCIVLVTAALLVFWIFRFSDPEDERLKLFLRVYKKTKLENPQFSEHKLLEAVAELCSPHGSGRTIKELGITGQRIIEDLINSPFSTDHNIVLKELIVHLMSLEYPEKYSPEFDLSVGALALWCSGKKTPRELRIVSLEARIEVLASEFGVVLRKKL